MMGQSLYGIGRHQESCAVPNSVFRSFLSPLILHQTFLLPSALNTYGFINGISNSANIGFGIWKKLNELQLQAISSHLAS